MIIDVYDLLGLFGVSLSLYSYARLQWQREYAKRLSYSLFNLLGSTFLMVSLFNKWNVASFTSNAIWALISIYGVYRCMKYIRGTKINH